MWAVGSVGGLTLASHPNPHRLAARVTAAPPPHTSPTPAAPIPSRRRRRRRRLRLRLLPKFHHRHKAKIPSSPLPSLLGSLSYPQSAAHLPLRREETHELPTATQPRRAKATATARRGAAPRRLPIPPYPHACDAAAESTSRRAVSEMVRFFRSGNLASRVFDRQLLSPRPGAAVNTIRQFYENLVPSYTIYDIDCPDYSFRKFTDDGQYLVAFSRNHQDLIVYRPIWLTYSCNEDCDSHDLPAKSKKFDSFFKQLYSIPLASSNEYICKDFFLYIECNQFGLFATSTAQSNDSTATEGAIHGVPSIEKITFYLVRLEDGVILDEKAFCNDFINLAHSIGAYLYEDLLCIVSLRYQTVHILQIRDSGNLVEVRRIGAFCREDDELFLHSHAQTGYGGSFLPGIKQRLLSYIFRKTWNEVPDQTLRVQHLKKKFYFHFQDYVDLIIWKVQFLDRHHLFIKFGSVDGGVSRSTDQNLAFFAVYNMETTDIVSLYENSSEELYSLFEQFYDHFHANPQDSSHGKFISSHSNDVHALDQLRTIKNKASISSQFVKKMMASLPYTCQSQSPSPYFDLSLFRYDEKLISAIDRHRHCTEHPIKFISVRQPNVVKFKIKPGSDSGASDSRAKRISSFLFHPFFPLALSIQQTYMQPTVVNIHFRR